jgi:hypothetical protein
MPQVLIALSQEVPQPLHACWGFRGFPDFKMIFLTPNIADGAEPKTLPWDAVGTPSRNSPAGIVKPCAVPWSGCNMPHRVADT